MEFPNGQTDELIVLLLFNQVFLDFSRKWSIKKKKEMSVRMKTGFKESSEGNHLKWRVSKKDCALLFFKIYISSSG